MSEKIEEGIKQQVGYGHGTTVGFSEDGLVFMTCDYKNEDGKPMQAIFTWDPKRATQIATSIVKAAESAKKMAGLKNVGSNSNGPH